MATDATIAMLTRALEATRYAALHDPLTGLANRTLILDHLRLALARADRASTLVGVIFFDIDDFKRINDTLGHSAGDEVLVRVAERLRPTVRPADTLGRWGGDEFVVVCEDLEQPSDAAAVVDRITAGLEFPFSVAGTEIHVGASIGVALSGGSDRAAVLIAAADSAMYRAKQDRPSGPRPGPDPLSWAPGALLPGSERLTHRLHELLLSVAIGDDQPAGRDHA
jgi:diguanylate cyclase (GGDEF)-like protein